MADPITLNVKNKSSLLPLIRYEGDLATQGNQIRELGGNLFNLQKQLNDIKELNRKNKGVEYAEGFRYGLFKTKPNIKFIIKEPTTGNIRLFSNVEDLKKFIPYRATDIQQKGVGSLFSGNSVSVPIEYNIKTDKEEIPIKGQLFRSEAVAYPPSFTLKQYEKLTPVEELFNARNVLLNEENTPVKPFFNKPPSSPVRAQIMQKFQQAQVAEDLIDDLED